MAVYHGVVKDNVVVLPEDARLPDGMTVEVHVPPMPPALPDAKQLLRARGLLLDATPTPPEAEDRQMDRRPIVVQGQPLSQTIIAERR